jgi:hypothetical protein
MDMLTALDWAPEYGALVRRASQRVRAATPRADDARDAKRKATAARGYLASPPGVRGRRIGHSRAIRQLKNPALPLAPAPVSPKRPKRKARWGDFSVVSASARRAREGSSLRDRPSLPPGLLLCLSVGAYTSTASFSTERPMRITISAHSLTALVAFVAPLCAGCPNADWEQVSLGFEAA